MRPPLLPRVYIVRMMTSRAGRPKVVGRRIAHIVVSTKNGYDTKYLFPGSVLHNEAYTAEVWISGAILYFHKAKVDGKATEFRYLVHDGDASNNTGTDLSGNVSGWDVSTVTTPDATLGFVRAYTGDALDLVNVHSFANTTPNTIVSALLAANESADLHFLGGRGNDTLRGSDWHDDFEGRKGADRMIGALGDDSYWVENKGDRVVEKSGQFSGTDQVLTTIDYKLGSNVENLDGLGSRGLKLTGNSKANTIWGTAGEDTIKGMDGKDVIAAYAGGKDLLYGGDGKDTFVYLAAEPTGADKIMDFKPLADTIMLLRTGFPSIAAVNFTGPLPDAFFAASKNGKAKDFNDYITYDTNDGKLFYDPDGSGAAARMLIVTFAGDPKLTAADILIV